MGQRSAHFYADGFKIHSGVATTVVNGRTLIVVCGSHVAGDGEIHLRDLPTKAELILCDRRVIFDTRDATGWRGWRSFRARRAELGPATDPNAVVYSMTAIRPAMY